MAISNRDRISKALDELRDGLLPFISSQLSNKLGLDGKKIYLIMRIIYKISQFCCFLWIIGIPYLNEYTHSDRAYSGIKRG